MKEQRFFLCKDADSYVKVSVSSYAVDLKMTDCNRVISWEFERHTEKQRKASLKKLKKFRKVINDLYEELEK